MIAQLLQLFRRKRRDPVIRQLRRDVGVDPSTFSVEDLRPVLIPSAILGYDQWVGPRHYVGSLPVSLTWAYLRPENTMIYLSFDAVAWLEAQHIDWRRSAKASLHQDFGNRPWTHEFKDESGVQAVALLHADGLGPSRLLCTQELKRSLSGDFDWYVPERSCAFAISKNASSSIRDTVATAIRRCYESAEVPMSMEALSSEALDSVVEALERNA
jgi:hypothetical protein